MASSQGHMTVIVALVEEGGANINQQTTDTEDTPLMLSVSRTLCIQDIYMVYWSIHRFVEVTMKQLIIY